jgi:hypothetical protein
MERRLESRDRVEFADHGGTAAALRGLAEASGNTLEYVVALAQKNELRKLFVGGRTYRHRSAEAPPVRRITPKQALVISRRRGWTAP